MPICKIPQLSDLQEIVSMLWGEDCIAKEGVSLDVDENPYNVVATYIGDDDEVAAVLVIDPQFAGYSGASLTLVPTDCAEGALKGEFTAPILENLHEVMNICSRLFLDDHSKHVRLDKVTVGPGSLPERIKSVLDQADSNACFRVSIPRYGDGRMRAIAL